MTRSTKAEAVKADDVEITELERIEPTRVDGVGTPATGFPILMMKSIAAPAAPAASPQKAKAAKCACGDGCTCAADAKAAKQAAKKAKKAERLGKQTETVHTGDVGKGSNSSSDADTKPDVIKKAVAKATASLEAELKTLREQVAKVLATPIPGGPLLVTPLTQRPADNPAKKNAERLRAIAAQTLDPEVARSYRELAAREEGAPIT